MSKNGNFNVGDEVRVTYENSKRHCEHASIVQKFPVTDEYTIKFHRDGYHMRIDGFKLGKKIENEKKKTKGGAYPAIAVFVLWDGDESRSIIPLRDIVECAEEDVRYVESEKDLQHIIDTSSYPPYDIYEVRLFPVGRSVSLTPKLTFAYTETDGG